MNLEPVWLVVLKRTLMLVTVVVAWLWASNQDYIEEERMATETMQTQGANTDDESVSVDE